MQKKLMAFSKVPLLVALLNSRTAEVQAQYQIYLTVSG